MEKIIIEKTSSSPAVFMDPIKGSVSLKGHSFPENTFSFYQPIMEWITAFIQNYDIPFVLKCELLYFNTSTAKVLFNIFELLDRCSAGGRDVKILWLYHPENDVSLMCGQEYSEDLQSVTFEILEHIDQE